MEHSHVEALRQVNADLLKENTMLFAQKRQIIDAGQKAVEHATLELDKLHARIGRIQKIVIDELVKSGIAQDVTRAICDGIDNELRRLA